MGFLELQIWFLDHFSILISSTSSASELESSPMSFVASDSSAGTGTGWIFLSNGGDYSRVRRLIEGRLLFQEYVISKVTKNVRSKMKGLWNKVPFSQRIQEFWNLDVYFQLTRSRQGQIQLYGTLWSLTKRQPCTRTSSRYLRDQRRLGTESDQRLFPTSLRGDVTSEIPKNDWEQGWLKARSIRPDWR